MRRFRDPDGREWDVVVGRESWGAFYALFVPRAPTDAPVRQARLDAEATDAAGLELERLDERALAALFDRSTPRTP